MVEEAGVDMCRQGDGDIRCPGRGRSVWRALGDVA